MSQENSDIKDHIPVLEKYAKQCRHITEMGVRELNSTWVFLKTKPKKLVSYDWDKFPYEVNRTSLGEALDYANSKGIYFQFIPYDTTQVEIEATDLLFIDTWHTYEQLLLELLLHSSNVSKYIVAHDTNEGLFPGMTCAIEDFLKENPQWQLDLMVIDRPGLTVLKRVQEAKTSWGQFVESDLRREIKFQSQLYYQSCNENGSTSAEWANYQDQQVSRFRDEQKWPKTNRLR
jgi:hypothetical protein